MDDIGRWLPDSPFCVPEWRWLRAAYLVEAGRRYDHRVDDEWVRHARDARRGRGRSNSPAATVREAREVWAGDPDRRGEVEARLLAGCTDADVADRVRLSERVVAAYAEVFFCVRPAVAAGASDWLLSEAVGYSTVFGFTRPLPHAAWRLAAVFGGPLFADVVIAATTGRPLPPAFRDPGGTEELRVRELARLWVAAMAAATPAAFACVLRDNRRLRTSDARRHGRKACVEPRILAMESFLLHRSATVGHLGRSDASGLSESAIDTTRGPGGEGAGSGRTDRLPSAGRPGHATRRTRTV